MSLMGLVSFSIPNRFRVYFFLDVLKRGRTMTENFSICLHDVFLRLV